jgi:hypothetical protein
MGGPPFAVEMAFRPIYHSEFCPDQNNLKIFEDLRNSKNMVFKVKKLLNVGVDQTLLRKGEKKRTRQN